MAQPPNLNQLLQDAITEHDLQTVQRLLKQFNVDLRRPENSYLLRMALSHDEVEIIEMFIRAGVDLDEEDLFDLGYSILHVLIPKTAKYYGNYQAYEQLVLLAIEHGAEVDARVAGTGSSVFEFAIASGSYVIARELLRCGVSLDYDDLTNILNRLTQWKDRKTVSYLLPLIMTSDQPTQAILNQRVIMILNDFFSSYKFQYYIFEELLKLITDIEGAGIEGDTMLVTASCANRVDVVEALLDLGADVNKKTPSGIYPIYAAATAEGTESTELLIKRGANLNCRNDDGKYAIHGACISRSVDNLCLLLGLGASIHVADNFGQYPIHVACVGMSEAILQILLNLGCNISRTDINGNTPLSLNKRQYPFSRTNLFIQHYSLLQSRRGAVNGTDMVIIYTNPETIAYYEKCYANLNYLRHCVIFGSFTCLSLLNISTTRLSQCMRNHKFAKALEKYVKFTPHGFVVYHYQLRMKVKIARKKLDLALNTENMLRTILHRNIPSTAIEKIAILMLKKEFRRIEIDCHSHPYKLATVKNKIVTSTYNNFRM